MQGKKYFWRKASEKETHDIGVEFEILEEEEFFLVNYKKLTGHDAFDVKIDFTHKNC